jgi:hypothetical protein
MADALGGCGVAGHRSVLLDKLGLGYGKLRQGRWQVVRRAPKVDAPDHLRAQAEPRFGDFGAGLANVRR